MKTQTIISVLFLLAGIFLLYPASLSAQGNDEQFSWMTLEEVEESAGENSKKIMLFMEADWCTICRRMKQEVFPDPLIQTTIKDHFYPVRIDIESREKISFDDET